MSANLVRLYFATTLLAFVVIVMGAYVRLSDAGLSCPDWPGCYGFIGVPSTQSEVQAAEQAFPQTPVETGKAWKEMIHRYLAGLLGICIAILAFWSMRLRRVPDTPSVLPWVLVALVCFQAALGMWTVTLLLKPLIVTAHLLGGMCTLGLLVWLALRHWGVSAGQSPRPVGGTGRWLGLALMVLMVQLILGAWTSANYAALACPDVPLCNGQVWPQMDLAEGFQLHRDLGRSADGRLITQDAMIAIHFVHRLGAVVTTLLVGGLALLLWLRHRGAVRLAAAAVLVTLALQIFLGISTVLEARPLFYAVAHNGNAALLLASLLALIFAVRSKPTTLIESTPSMAAARV